MSHWTILAIVLGSLGLSPAISSAQSRSIKATSAQLETLYLNNDRSYSYNLVAANRGMIDRIVIPQGATIVGQYVPAKGGLRYVAEAVTYDRYSYRISASSLVLKDVKDPRDTSVGAIAEDAAIGAAGGIVLGEVFGDAGVGEILGGAAAGVLVGNVTADRVVVIDPNAPIILYNN
ncbi:hypothetical protein IQ255_16430 [Pleurocapsales cyanobacterium LEGE 10410]|nr:hypothetical protein [Pleurocapsales cyanobacterium LEGE 10410]